MFFPKLTASPQQRRTVDRFLGLDRRAGSAMGSFQDMENLWAGGYPALETRPPRGTTAVLKAPHGLVCRDAPVWVDGTALYVNGDRTGLVLTEGGKQLVSMGAYLLIWPDKKYINTQDLTEFGSMEHRTVTTGEVTISLCRSGGEELGSYSIGGEAPAAPGTGSLWMDTADGEPVLKRYDGSSWLEVEDVCTKAASAGIGQGFRAGDGVTVEGCETEGLDGLHVLQAVGDDWIVVPVMCRTVGSQTAAVTVTCAIPDMDFVAEQGNRLWGCKYGIVNGEPVNEIYASKLGDFRNWNSFAGLSTDSYVASRGSDGVFTGAAACLGGVIFFKEDCMERVYPSASGAHQIVTVRCPGVKKGCGGSAALVDGTLFYVGANGVYAFDGSMPVCVSQPLGSVRYESAVAAGWNGQYWLAAQDAAGKRHVLVYDTARGLWHRQDDADIMAFTVCGGAAGTRRADGQYQKLRSMIVKTADQVKRSTEELTARLQEEYVAVSDFGSYVASLSAYLEANPEAVTQYYSFFSDLKADVEAVDAAFRHYKVDTEGYIRTGIVSYDGAVPVYGVAVGQDLVCREVDGQQVVEQNNFRAVFTATRLSFWQDATEVAYVSNNRLYITNITVLGGIAIGDWSVEAAESGLLFRWIGG